MGPITAGNKNDCERKNNFDFNKMINHGQRYSVKLKDAIVLKIPKDGLNL